MQPTRVIIGPTAAGKSGLAMQLAEARNLSIVSADSRQIYRGFDIGTAKPHASELVRIPHFGVDIISPTQRYSAHQWAEDACGWIAESHRAGRDAVVVGGTGFYIRSLIAPLAAMPEISRVQRDALASMLDAMSFEAVRQWCERLDPARATLGRTQMYRAIEIALFAGARISDLIAADRAVGHASPVRQTASETVNATSAGNEPVTSHPAYAVAATRDCSVHYLVVDPGLPLADRIRNRVASMIQQGWIDEVRNLMTCVPEDAPAWLASGYAAMRRHVRGELSLADAREQVVIETRQYAKRQRTWCRHQLRDGPVTHISPDDSNATSRVLDWWDSAETTS